jgi:hypothetical protein
MPHGRISVLFAAAVACATAAGIDAVRGRARAQESEYDPAGGRVYTPAPVSPRQVGLIGTLEGDSDAEPTRSPPPARPRPSTSPFPPAPPVGYVPPPNPSDVVPPPPAPPDAGRSTTPRYPWAARSASLGSELDAAGSDGVHIPSRIATRLRALDRDFTALSLRGGTNVSEGVLSIVTGGLAIALGFLFQESAPEMATYLHIYGGGSVARGGAQLLLSPNPSDAALVFAHMPMTSVDEVKERLRFGERELESLAVRSRLARIVDGSINVLTGAAFVPFYLAPRDFAVGEAVDFFVLIAVAYSIVSGIITLATRTEAERRWDAYEDLRARMRRSRRPARTADQPAFVEAALPMLHAGASGLPGSGSLTVTTAF